MTPKKTENINTSDYIHQGQTHWKEHTSTYGKFNPGIANFKPRVEMLSPTGMIKTFYNHENKTQIDVLYDSEYVYEHYYQKLVVTMGWMETGSLDEEVFQLFFNHFFDYCSNVGEKQRLAHLDKRANELAIEFPNLTAEQWKEFLIQQASNATKKEDSQPTEPVESESSSVPSKKAG
ncbi:hypothetical protein, partial [Nostoc sp.]|uniref:hypothetical protein n=1 Tax=Nostoc sp. TaxID=1180 RepID=UPI002FF16D8C